MAWRPSRFLLEGELDNTTLGKVVGWMKFAGMQHKVTFDLAGNFHRDIRGAKIHLTGEGKENDPEAAGYLKGFSLHQTGKVGDITAGLPPRDYVDYPYVEIYGEDNGRVVIELAPEQVKVIGTPIPSCESDPISREEQNRNMSEFLGGIAQEMGLPPERALCVGSGAVSSPAQKGAKAKDTQPHQMQLLTKEIREKLPPLYAQEGKAGKAVVYVKFFTPDSSWTWFATEFDGQDLFFGLVDGHYKEMGYFSLSELQSARGPMGLAIERDLHWEPKMLCEIAPELFDELPYPPRRSAQD